MVDILEPLSEDELEELARRCPDRKSLVGIFPNRQLHSKEVHAHGIERCYESAIRSTQD
jgi:hypothetical protein